LRDARDAPDAEPLAADGAADCEAGPWNGAVGVPAVPLDGRREPVPAGGVLTGSDGVVTGGGVTVGVVS
jgi:hypothetical protein